MSFLRNVSEQVARKTSRRGLFGRGAEVVFGAIAGVAAGTATQSLGQRATAGIGTQCSFPGPPCSCENCQENGVCAKPCIILTTYYASGCWVASTNGATCCDCNCEDISTFGGDCGCGSDYHNDPAFCP
jgi:hypothetical protein